MISRQPDQAGVQSKILGWLQEKMPQARNLSISNMERPGTGLSNDTFVFGLSWEEAGQQRSEGRVVRCAPISYPIYAEFDLRNQFHVLDRLQGTDVPSPRVYWYEEDENLLGAPFFLMDKLEGVIPPDFPPYHSFGPYYDATPDRRARMWWSSLETMAKVHKVDWKRREEERSYSASIKKPRRRPGSITQTLSLSIMWGSRGTNSTSSWNTWTVFLLVTSLNPESGMGWKQFLNGCIRSVMLSTLLTNMGLFIEISNPTT